MKMAAFLIWFSIALLQAETSQHPAPEAFGAFEDALMQTRAAVKAHWMVTLDTLRDSDASLQKLSQDTRPEATELSWCWPPLQPARMKVGPGGIPQLPTEAAAAATCGGVPVWRGLRCRATTLRCLPGDTREFLRQCNEGARIVGAREALLVGSQAAHIVHFVQELAGAEGVAGILPGQLQQAETLGTPLILAYHIAVQVRADLWMVQIGLARGHEDA